MVLEGSIEAFDLAEIIQLISRTRKTGKLVISGAKSFVTIHFKEGRAVFASPAYQHDYIGNILVREGLVSRAEVDAALQEQRRLRRKGFDVLIGSVLVDHGALDRRTLENIITRQIEETVLAALMEKTGSFKFEHDDDISEANVVARVDAEWVLLESSRQLDEWREICATAPGRDAVLAINPNVGGTAVNLEMEDWRIVSVTDGTRTVDEIIEHARTSRLAALKAIAKLVSLGVVVQKNEPHNARAEWDPVPRYYQKPERPEGNLLRRIVNKIKNI
jgi:hypothetical protein